MIYYKFEYFNIPPPSKIQFPTPPVKFDEGPGFTWVLGSRVRVPGPGFTYSRKLWVWYIMVVIAIDVILNFIGLTFQEDTNYMVYGIILLS